MENGELTVVDETSTTPTLSQSQFDMVDVNAAKAAQENFGELVEALLDEKNDYQGGKKKKSAWRKLARAFNISDEIIEHDEIREDDHQIISAHYIVKATLPNGRSSIGVGDCSIFDKIRYHSNNPKVPVDTETPSNFVLRGRFSNAEHDVPATAHTRAKSRAIADLIGAGEVSAEELDDNPKQVSRTPANNNTETTKSTTSKSDEKPKTTTNARRRRTRKKPAEPEVVDAEVIETQKVEESTSEDSLEDYAEKHPALKKAIDRINEGGDELTKSSIVDELYALYDLGTITIDEYYEAKEALNNKK